MHKRKLAIFVYWVSGIVQVLLTSLSVAGGTVYKLEQREIEYLGQWAKVLLVWVHLYAWLIIAFLPVSLAMIQSLRNRIGAPWIWEHVHFLLNGFQATVFSGRSTQHLHHHRVTLFQYKKFYLCLEKKYWTRCLVPVARSMYTSQETKTKFKVPDSMDKAEGIAGLTWAKLKIVSVRNLPDLSNNPTLQKKKEYARRTNVTLELVESRLGKSNPRSLCGIPVEVKNNPWGVIILDSRDPHQIGNTETSAYFSFIGKNLGKLLERT